MNMNLNVNMQLKESIALLKQAVQHRLHQKFDNARIIHTKDIKKNIYFILNKTFDDVDSKYVLIIIAILSLFFRARKYA